MNAKDKMEFKDLAEKIDTVDKNNLKLYHRMEKILSILEDDSHSSSEGLITRVNNLNKQVDNLMVMNKAIQKVSVFLIGIVGSISTYFLKIFFFNE